MHENTIQDEGLPVELDTERKWRSVLVRLQPDLREKLVSAARQNRCSMNAMAQVMIERGLRASETAEALR